MTYVWGTGIRGLMRGMTTLPQDNQEPSVVKVNVGRPPGELGVSKSAKGIRFVKRWVLVCWW